MLIFVRKVVTHSKALGKVRKKTKAPNRQFRSLGSELS